MEDFDGWLDCLLSKVQPLYVDVALYVRVFADPDPAKIERYGVETAFYLEDDPAVMLARELQRGAEPGGGDVDRALAEGANSGGYGRSLELGMRRLREASAYWRGERPEPPDLRQ
jgi:hypothetical protein